MMQQILPLDPSRYQRHLIHGAGRNWAETNCYADVWIELLHALGFEPIAALPFTLAIDFEGDQWTFFKFPHGDLYELYGLDVHELAIWRPLVSHIEEQVLLGRPVLVELDSYYLPDTAGTSYQHAHVKSTVAVNAIDLANRKMGYFHNQAYHFLEGDDYTNVFYLAGPGDSSRMPPYVEFVKRGPGQALGGDSLVNKSVQLLRHQLRLAPVTSPFARFKPRFAADLDWLTRESLDVFHQYSFATLRQFGACYELAATYLQWLGKHGVERVEEPMAAFTDLSTGAKTLQFQLARTMTRKKPLDMAPLDHMTDRWQTAMTSLKAGFLG